MATNTDEVPNAVTDVLAHVSCDNQCLIAGETCADGSAFVGGREEGEGKNP